MGRGGHRGVHDRPSLRAMDVSPGAPVEITILRPHAAVPIRDCRTSEARWVRPLTETEIPAPIRSLAAAMKAEMSRSLRLGIDPMHHIDVIRDGKRILRVGVPDPDDVLQVLYHAPGAMCADYIAVAADSWLSTDLTNPITGERWAAGDMAEVVHMDLGLHRGLIDEGLIILGFPRGGTPDSASLDYTRDSRTKKYRWATLTMVEPLDGRFQTAAENGFARPTVIEATAEVAGPPPGDYDVGELEQKCAVSWVHQFPPRFRIIEAPKGPPLIGDNHRYARMGSSMWQ